MEFPYTVAAVVGGDDRQRLLVSMLAATGVLVKAFGIDVSPGIPGVEICDTLDCIWDAQAVFLPIPYRNSQGLIPTMHGGVTIEQFAPHLRPGMQIFLGRGDALSSAWQGVYVTDLLTREDFQVWNAVPSAEGALQLAMAYADVTLWRSECLILGYGRIGRVLADRLRHMGAYVTVEARKPEDIARIEVDGHHAVQLSQLWDALPRKRLIFNTIPHRVLDRPHLTQVDRDAVILDLASHPGGVDYDAAREMGIYVRAELGLPGRLSPRTAAHIVLQAANTAWLETVKQNAAWKESLTLNISKEGEIYV